MSANRQRLAKRERVTLMFVLLAIRLLNPDWRFADPYKAVVEKIDTMLMGKDDEE